MGGVRSMDLYDATTFEPCFIEQRASVAVLGILCGMWERAHGRTYRISLNKEMIFFM